MGYAERTGYAKRLWKNSLDIAEKKGTKAQFYQMTLVVSQTAHFLGELEYLFSGDKKQAENGHHPVRDLVNSSIDGIVQTLRLRKEIETASL